MMPDYGKITSWLFSHCGRFLYGLSIQTPSRVLVFDTERREMVKTIYNPLYRGVFSAMTLTMHDEEIYASGTSGGGILIARLPLRPDSKYEARMAAVGPFGLQNCERLRVIFADATDGGGFILVGQGTNYLRKDGKIGGNSQWPIVLSVKEEDMEKWIAWPLLEEPKADDAVKAIKNEPETLEVEDNSQLDKANEAEARDGDVEMAVSQQNEDFPISETQILAEDGVCEDLSSHESATMQAESGVQNLSTSTGWINDDQAAQMSAAANELRTMEPGDEEVQDMITETSNESIRRPGIGFMPYQAIFHRFL
jgi:hypothetical protein